jgi:hypothetical protein
MKTCGPAFPGVIKNSGTEVSKIYEFEVPPNEQLEYVGISIRDYFASEALGGMLAHSRNGHGYRPRDPNQDWHDAISEEAYELADAIIRARELEASNGR